MTATKDAIFLESGDIDGFIDRTRARLLALGCSHKYLEAFEKQARAAYALGLTLPGPRHR